MLFVNATRCLTNDHRINNCSDIGSDFIKVVDPFLGLVVSNLLVFQQKLLSLASHLVLLALVVLQAIRYFDHIFTTSRSRRNSKFS